MRQAQHKKMVDALENGDKDTAEQLIRDHLLNASKTLSNYFLPGNLP